MAWQYTGRRVYVYIDQNPYSPTFNQMKFVDEIDETCNYEDGDWRPISEYCELENGVNTGYYVAVIKDFNRSSATYGQTAETKTYSEDLCPKPSTDPKWVEDITFQSYCEQMYYEPSHTQAPSGYYISRQIDDNPNSATYQQTRDSRELSDYCEPPSTSPLIEEVSYACEYTTDADGNLLMTGNAIITGIDRNIFSPSYLSSTSTTVSDQRCPVNSIYKFTAGGGLTELSAIVGSGETSTTISVVSTLNGSSHSYTASTSADWISITTAATAVTINATTNTGSLRSAEITLTQADSLKTIVITLAQQSGEQIVEDTFCWNTHEGTAYTATSVAANQDVQIDTFTSVKDQQNVNAVITASETWVHTTGYTYGNELAPNTVNTIILDNNESENDRTAVITLTQKNTQNQLTCTITQLGIPPAVCDCNSFVFDGSIEPTSAISFTIKIKNNSGNEIYCDDCQLEFTNGQQENLHPGCTQVSGDGTIVTFDTVQMTALSTPLKLSKVKLDVSHQNNCTSYGIVEVTTDITNITNGCTLTLIYDT